ncbi:MAG: hypothetical protein HRU09_05400 [Oligoflexales bacterium]|nr:hypothetical protein [Oligoflexales bacterium]
MSSLILISFIIYDNSNAADFEDFKINSSYGRTLVEKLKNSIERKSTTSVRREQKTVTYVSHLHERLELLQDPFKKKRLFKKSKTIAVVFTTRDQTKPGYKNVTYTFYGRGAYFWNLGIKTKIKLRARFYLLENLENGVYERPEQMASYSFLELKIKNPSPAELNSVNKYRVKIEDTDLIKLINSEVDDISSVLVYLKDKALSQAQGKKIDMVNTMFSVIDELATIEPKFTKPQFAISYERTAKKYLEEKYKAKIGLLKRKSFKDMEYQLTLDQNIKGYRIPSKFMSNSSSFIEFFQGNKDNFNYQYPEDCIVAEIKVPIAIANLDPKACSAIHKHIYEGFIKPVFNQESLYPGFRLNKGKAGHFKRVLAEKGVK